MYETLFQTIIDILLIIYRNKLNCLEERGSVWFIFSSAKLCQLYSNHLSQTFSGTI